MFSDLHWSAVSPHSRLERFHSHGFLKQAAFGSVTMRSLFGHYASLRLLFFPKLAYFCKMENSTLAEHSAERPAVAAESRGLVFWIVFSRRKAAG